MCGFDILHYQQDLFTAYFNLQLFALLTSPLPLLYRNVGNGVLHPASWQIVFDLPYVDLTATYVLRLELAAANLAEVQVN